MTVIVDDINDHGPIFTQVMYEASVRENADVRTLVAQVKISLYHYVLGGNEILIGETIPELVQYSGVFYRCKIFQINMF